MIFRLFVLCSLALALYFGYQMGSGSSVEEKRLPPVTQQQKFVVVIYGSNDAHWVEKRALLSTFRQEYDDFRVIFIDDHSSDGTFEKVEKFLLENRQETKAILIRNEEKLGKVGSLYRIKECLLDREIVLFLDAKDAFLQDSALQHLNQAYQREATWMTLSPFIEYPSYQKKGAKGGSCFASTFYASLFKEIPLIELMEEGRFSLKEETFLQKLADFSAGHIYFPDEPLLLHAQLTALKKKKEISFEKRAPLSALPSSSLAPKQIKLLLFSYNRPLQLFACLESVERYFSGLSHISVIYRAGSSRFFQAYEEVRRKFPQVRFILQNEARARKEFKSLVMQEVFDREHEYILFGVDDLIAKDFVDLSSCATLLEKTKAYGFYLRFGKHINFCYQIGKPQKVPESISLGDKVFAWDILQAEHDWAFANTLDMTLFHKETLREPFKKMRFKHPNSLEFHWMSDFAPKKALGLYFEESKVLNLPLNVVNNTGNPHMNFETPEGLLTLFEEQMKIDIDPFYKLPNTSPHYDCLPGLIPR